MTTQARTSNVTGVNAGRHGMKGRLKDLGYLE
jgi:hypothetical protein